MCRPNNMIGKLVLCLLTLCLAFDFIAPGSLHENASVPMKPRAHKKPGPVKNIFKRTVIGCRNDTQYMFQGLCCDSCRPGSVAKAQGCTKDNPTTSCKTCIHGEEYMDHYNYHPTCLRCGHCDTQHGLEVETNCTIQQNVKCRCRSGYFCNSSECRHCDRCDMCKDGKILESCTETQNTKCDRTEIVQKDSTTTNVAAIVVPLVFLGMVIGVIIWCVHKKKKTAKFRVKQKATDLEQNRNEMVRLHYSDIDLLPHLPDIAEEMLQPQVKAFVRKLNVQRTRIEVIVSDNQNDGTEQKIKMLECWYQEHGIKGAYKTLITTLRDLNYRATADKIEKIIDHAHAQENINQTPP